MNKAMNNAMNKAMPIFSKLLVIAFLSIFQITAHDSEEIDSEQFNQLSGLPNNYRSVNGSPGFEYWQQGVDYRIKATLNESKRRLSATQTITYKNNSPDTLRYLWLYLGKPQGMNIKSIQTSSNDNLSFIITDTRMRIDLPKPLKSGKSFKFEISYAYNIAKKGLLDIDFGYEHFPNDARKGGNDVFTINQWHPRLIAYTDYQGWAVNRDSRYIPGYEFADFYVELTVPADHLVSSSGELDNPSEVLSSSQRKRLSKAGNAKNSTYIVTPQEALDNEKHGTRKTKTWEFRAENVLTLSWASSRKFIWKAKGYNSKRNAQSHVMAMSFYTKDLGHIFERDPAEAIIDAIISASKQSYSYPYPVVQIIDGSLKAIQMPQVINLDQSLWPRLNRALNRYLDRSLTKDKGASSNLDIALNVLRDSVLGPKLFDYSLRAFLKQWMFKRPTADDFYRSMEQTSGVDLDWFWQSWINDSAKVDISVKSVSQMLSNNSISEPSKLGMNIYSVELLNHGGVVMPLDIELSFSDGSKEIIHLPRTLWRDSESKITTIVNTEKILVKLIVDPQALTGDSDTFNNRYPRLIEKLIN